MSDLGEGGTGSFSYQAVVEGGGLLPYSLPGSPWSSGPSSRNERPHRQFSPAPHRGSSHPPTSPEPQIHRGVGQPHDCHPLRQVEGGCGHEGTLALSRYWPSQEAPGSPPTPPDQHLTRSLIHTDCTPTLMASHQLRGFNREPTPRPCAPPHTNSSSNSAPSTMPASRNTLPGCCAPIPLPEQLKVEIPQWMEKLRKG